jgi:2-keto-4-pentenoate hydratase/2-oxohepta-3-ene-1,7-dioic acid hydratase in catechol pathway
VTVHLWIRYEAHGQAGFGLLEGDRVAVFQGDLFGAPEPTGQSILLADVTTTLPCVPGKLIGLWNNYHAQAGKQGLSIPAEPLWFIKAASSYCAHGQPFTVPASYAGRVVYEGELGLVIGKTCKNISVDDAADAIFGVTCVNDVTALDLLSQDPSFAQWARAKSFDTFGIFGPVIATGLDWQTLNVKTLVNGRERQNYPCSDMIFSPARIVSSLSREMTLHPGDVIACGTSLGVLPIKPGTVVEIVIDGIGVLKNTFESNTLSTTSRTNP